MKIPFFWEAPQSSLWPKLFFPLSYLWIKETKSRLKKIGYKSSIPVICIGNITIGGSGKTQAAIKLAEFYKQHGFRPVFLSRGYKSKAKQATKVDSLIHSYEDVGDEPLLLSQFAEAWVSPNRKEGAKAIEEQGGADIIIMDDGMQNPSLYKDFNLLIVDGIFGLGNQKVIPAGPLREPLEENINRIDYGIMIGEDYHHIQKQLLLPFLQAHIKPKENNLDKSQKYWAFCGLGRPSKFYETLKQEGFNIACYTDFSDHHPYTEKEIKDLIQASELNNCRLITTEKDKMRIPTALRSQIDYLNVTLDMDFTPIKNKLPLFK